MITISISKGGRGQKRKNDLTNGFTVASHVHITVEVYGNDSPFGYEEHKLTLSDDERFIGIAMVLTSDKDEEDAPILKPIDKESDILIQ